MTPLDAACTTPFHEADEVTRAAILRRLADTELHVAMAGEAASDSGQLLRLDTAGGPLAIACDSDERLAGFFGRPTDYAAMPGRVLAGMLEREGVGLLVNPGTPSEMLLDSAALGWLVRMLSARPDPAESTARLDAPDPEIADLLLPALGGRLAEMAGLAQSATLTRAVWQDGHEGHLLLIKGAAPGVQAAMAKAIGELVAFLPPVKGGLDVSFAELPAPAGAPRVVIEAPPAPPPKPAKPKGPPILR